MNDNHQTIIWDWNGTLLNDVDQCIDSMNTMLLKRQRSPISKKKYIEIFTFPVKEYYETIGWDFNNESWDEIANEFMQLYFSKLGAAGLHKEALPVIKYFHKKNYPQAILSAMEHNALVSAIKKRGILQYFDQITGIEDHFAHSKIEVARKLIRNLNVSPGEATMIGDTIHDYEVAKELGCQCVLVAIGHQTYERLKKSGCRVMRRLNEIPGLFGG